MLYGIEFKDSKEGLKEYPEEVREDIATTDRFDIYFSNPVTAIKVANYYEKLDENILDYSVFELTTEQEKMIDKSRIVDTFEQYKTMHSEHVRNAISETLERNKINKLMAYYIKNFCTMPPVEQEQYPNSQPAKEDKYERIKRNTEKHIDEMSTEELKEYGFQFKEDKYVRIKRKFIEGFDAMSPEEQDEYLRQMGLSVQPVDDKYEQTCFEI